MTSRMISAGRPCDGAEDFRQFVRRRDLELIVAAVGRLPVRPPPQKDRRMPEAAALEMVVLHLADTLDPQRLPRQILAGAPPALSAGHPRVNVTADIRPFPPRMVDERVLAQRRQLARERLPRLHRERGCDADVLQPAAIVVQ